MNIFKRNCGAQLTIISTQGKHPTCSLPRGHDGPHDDQARRMRWEPPQGDYWPNASSY